MINKKELVRSRLSIVDKNSKVVPFTRNAVQRYFAAHKGNRNIILKSRQLGISSEILADMFAESITIPNTPCAVVSHETRATQRLLDRVHFFYDTFPNPRPLIGAESRSELSFPGLNSSIYLGTAGSRAFGRGDTLRMAHLSELAFYDDPERILSGVQDAVPHSGELTIECTANGMDNLFYELWTKAKEKKSPYKPFFFPWWLGEDYRLAKGNPDVLEGDEGKLYYNEEEQGLVNKFHLVEDQIRWRRWKIAEKGGQFYQDFPEDEVTCFEQSGEPVFDPYLVQILARNCYDGERHAQGFHFWIPPQEKMLYVIGADSAAGVAGGSFSAAAVLDLNFNIVATFQGLLELTQFKDLLVQMGRWYNNAELAVERNTPGYAVLTGLLDYPNVYRQRDFLTGRITDKLGWWTSDATKSHMVTTFKDMLPRVKTWDMNLVRQMRGYQYIRYKAKAQASDDLLMATMIAVAVRKLSGGAAGYRGKIPGYSGGSWD